VGIISGGSAETLDPGVINQWPDTTRGGMLYNKLFSVSKDLKLLPALALSAEPNKDASVWTLKLRDGVTWHDGKPFGADDIVAAFHGWSKPTNFNNGALAGMVDFKGVRKKGKLEVEVPLVRPVALFPSVLTIWTGSVPQAGSTPESFKTKPIGTGPFKFVSFTPGKRSVFERNPDYWESGKPYLDRVIVDSSFTDESARLNAMLSGQVDALHLIPFNTAKQQANSGKMKILASDGGQNYMISFRIDKAPFDDVRVRQAMKHIVDREAMVNGVFAGYAKPFNDLLGSPLLKYYDSSLKATHDPEKAKALLKAAGKEGLTFELPIAPAGAGFVEAATLFAEQAKAAGVNVKLKNIPTANYYAPTPGNYTYRLVQLDGGAGFSSLLPYYRAFLMAGAPAGSAHYGTPEHDKLIYDAVAELDDAKATEKWQTVQQTLFNTGGTVAYVDVDWVDAVAPNVQGLSAGRAAPFDDMRFLDAWFSSGS
jgi:peptide/nickel transport system substrate-binding protein